MSPEETGKLLNTRDKAKSYIKNRAFDFVALVIIIAMSLLSLGFIELRKIAWENVSDILIECIPLYFAATLLSNNYYIKGTYSAKQSEKFIEAVKHYTSWVNRLTGDMLNKLHGFCVVYNESVKSRLQESLLRGVGISYSLYDVGDESNNIKPLKSLSKSDLRKLFNKNVTNVILDCNKIKVKGINVNILLGNINCHDSTDLGLSEKQLQRKRVFNYATTYLLIIVAISIIGVKDIMEWGWMGAALTLFKVMYIASGAYMKYFDGYEDVDVNVVNHLYRKADIIKEFSYEYEKSFGEKTLTIEE